MKRIAAIFCLLSVSLSVLADPVSDYQAGKAAKGDGILMKAIYDAIRKQHVDPTNMKIQVESKFNPAIAGIQNSYTTYTYTLSNGKNACQLIFAEDNLPQTADCVKVPDQTGGNPGGGAAPGM
jgi:hypothetical protein